MKNDMKNLVRLWVNLSRAYEIALLGDFTIQIVFDKEYRQGYNDYEQIKSFYNDIRFVKNGDLICEIHKPDYDLKNTQYETLTDIRNRVERAKQNKLPTKFKNNTCDALLKKAADVFMFSFQKREKVIEIARHIAQLDNCSEIESHHIAEACQYNAYDGTGCNAEARTINFGEGIKIALHELDYSDIENAINYLKQL